jgi:hypothetical protein
MSVAKVSKRLLQVWHGLPTVLALALLVYQVSVPWLVPHFTTQDGPSHVYSATVLRDLMLHHKTSVYSALYTVQRHVLPNWTSTVVLAAGGAVAGAQHDEQLFIGLAFLIGFLAWCYARRSLAPAESRFTPVANFVYQTWFLWIGFFNFYLGMALLPLAIGWYACREGRLTPRRAAVLALLLLALFATHLIGAAVAMVVVLATAFWVHIAVPLVRGENPGRRRLPTPDRLRQFGWALLAAAPVVVLMGMFAAHAPAAVKFDSQIAWAWRQFPMHIFLTAGGEAGQRLLWEVLLGYAGLAVVLFKKQEWASAKGGLVLATLLIFAVYLLVPDRGFGGSEAKIRFSWAVFVLAGLVACSASRLRYLHVPLAIFFAWFGWSNALATQRTASAISHVAADYMAVAGRIAPGSSLVRLRYPTPQLAAQYGYEGAGKDPVFHLDALTAAAGRSLDLSDYEALSRMFPVVFKSYVDAGQLSGLWSFEGPDPDSDKTLDWINGNFPMPADFVLVVGDVQAAEAQRMGMPHMIGYLDSTMSQVASSPHGLFRLYERRCDAPRQSAERAPRRACVMVAQVTR